MGERVEEPLCASLDGGMFPFAHRVIYHGHPAQKEERTGDQNLALHILASVRTCALMCVYL